MPKLLAMKEKDSTETTWDVVPTLCHCEPVCKFAVLVLNRGLGKDRGTIGLLTFLKLPCLRTNITIVAKTPIDLIRIPQGRLEIHICSSSHLYSEIFLR